LKEEIFQDVYKHYLADYSLNETLGTLAVKWDYPDGEHLRWDLKNERLKRGLPPKNQQDQKKNSIIRKVGDKPRVAVLDIETLPGIGYFWSLWDQNISLEQIIEDSCMLGWAAKFLNESEIYSDIMTSKEAINRDVSRIAKSCWDFMSQCDVIIGHNMASFDAKHINSAFLECNLPPLKYITVDTLIVAKANFAFSSNKLAFLNKKLGIRDKLSNEGFPMWAKCSRGEEEALATMKGYNEGDIYSTEELFYKIRPYVRNFNVALYNQIDTRVCPVCGGDSLEPEGHYYTSAGKWISYRCQDCKCVSRGKENLLSKDKKKSLLINS